MQNNEKETQEKSKIFVDPVSIPSPDAEIQPSTKPDTTMFGFNRDEINFLKKNANTYVRFKDRKLRGFTFTFSSDSIEVLEKLNETLVLLSHCMLYSKQLVQANIPIDLKLVGKRIDKIKQRIYDLKFDTLLYEYNNRTSALGRERTMREINKIILDNKKEIIEVLSFMELLRPLYIRPLTQSTVGVSSEEYEDIEYDEGEIPDEGEVISDDKSI
jgi:hypothetical protein